MKIIFTDSELSQKQFTFTEMVQFLWKRDARIDFAASVAITKVSAWGASWTLNLYNSMKVLENQKNVLCGLRILPDNIC